MYHFDIGFLVDVTCCAGSVTGGAVSDRSIREGLSSLTSPTPSPSLDNSSQRQGVADSATVIRADPVDFQCLLGI